MANRHARNHDQPSPRNAHNGPAHELLLRIADLISLVLPSGDEILQRIPFAGSLIGKLAEAESSNKLSGSQGKEAQIRKETRGIETRRQRETASRSVRERNEHRLRRFEPTGQHIFDRLVGEQSASSGIACNSLLGKR